MYILNLFSETTINLKNLLVLESDEINLTNERKQT